MEVSEAEAVMEEALLLVPVLEVMVQVPAQAPVLVPAPVSEVLVLALVPVSEVLVPAQAAAMEVSEVFQDRSPGPVLLAEEAEAVSATAVEVLETLVLVQAPAI